MNLGCSDITERGQISMSFVLVLLTVPVVSSTLSGTDPFVVVNEIEFNSTIMSSEMSASSLDSTDPVDVFCLLGTDIDVYTSKIFDRFATESLVVIIDAETTNNSPNSTSESPVNTDVDISFHHSDMTVFMSPFSTVDAKSMICVMYWGDTTWNIFTFGNNDEPLSHQYAEKGVYRVSISCTKGLDTIHVPDQDTQAFSSVHFFQDHYKSIYTPLVYPQTEPIQIQAQVDLHDTVTDHPTMYWRVIRTVNATSLQAVSNITQPNSITLFLGAGVLDPGDYIVILEVIFSTTSWVDDYIFIRVTVPDLITVIEGGDYMTIPYGEIHYVNGSQSGDPLLESSSEGDERLQIIWRCGFMYNNTSPFESGFFESPYQAYVEARTYQVKIGSEILLKLDTSYFTQYYWLLVMLKLQRGQRVSTTVQFLYLKPNIVPFSIKCVSNCNIGRDRKFIRERIELDTVFPDYINDTSIFTFNWYITVISSDFCRYQDHNFSPSTGYYQASFHLHGYQLIQGCNYRIGVYVSSPGYFGSFVYIVRNAGIIPYAGSCEVSPDTGSAIMDMFTISCYNWRALDRRVNTSSQDINGQLTYRVWQTVYGAVVYTEPVLETRYPVFKVILKVGCPYYSFENIITVEILDLHKNKAKFYFVVKVYPVISLSSVTPDMYGAAKIRDFAAIYEQRKLELYQVANVEQLLPLAISACSHLHLIYLPDVSSTGNPDPASVAIQEFLEELSVFVQNLTNDYIITNGNRKYDQLTKSLLTNLLNNIAGKEQYVNKGTKFAIISLGEVVGVSSLEDIQTGLTVGDMSGEIENAADEVADMYHTITSSAVPNTLRKITPVNLTTSSQQILEVLASSDSLSSDLTEAEKVYLFTKMQLNLRYNADKAKAEARASADMTRRLMRTVQDNLRLCDRCDNTGNNRTKQLVAKNTAADLAGRNFSMSNSTFKLDELGFMLADGAQTSVSATELTDNVFMYDDDGVSSIISSNILHIDVKANDTYLTPGFVTFEMMVTTPTPLITSPFVDPEDISQLSLHRFLYQSKTDAVCFIVKPVSGGDILINGYTVYIKFDGSPTILDHDVIVSVSPSTDWKVCLLSEQMGDHIGLMKLGVHVPGSVKEVDYEFTLVTVACLTWDETVTRWLSNKCDLEWLPDQNKIRCFCRDITEMTFGNSFYVAPNSIDFNSVFLKFSPLNQAAVIGTLSGLYVIFILATLILRRIDQHDVLKWSVTPLMDNKFGSDNFYLIQVFTGMRRGAGTRSHVGINLTGDISDTGIRHLYDGIRKEFSTGSVVTFLMATTKPLGRLEHLYIWHDNTGEGDLGPWYLDNVTVYDISRKTASTFVGERWLSVDTSCDATLKAISQETKLGFETRFFSQARRQLSDNHMWMSILYRPQSSCFTRVQRGACALCFIFLTMIANAMYFNPDSDLVSPPLFTVGPFRFTGKQVYVSIISALITTPAVMFLVFLFKHIRPTPAQTAQSKNLNTPDQLPSNDPDTGFCKVGGQCGSIWGCWHRVRPESKSLNYQPSNPGQYIHEPHVIDRIQLQKDCNLSKGVPLTMSGFSLHHKFVYVSWLMVGICVVTCSFFIMLYSMEWGKQKSEDWLSSIFMSIIESIIVIDPILVLCISMILACVIHKSAASVQYDVDAIVKNYRMKMGLDKVGVAGCLQLMKSIKWDYDPSMGPPPTDSKLEEATQKNKLHHETSSMMWNLILNLWFLLLVFGICYSNRDPHAYNYQKHMIDQLVEPEAETKFMDIKTRGDFFTWLNSTALPELFPVKDINGVNLHSSYKLYTEEILNLRVGPPRLRQLRVHHESCTIPFIGTINCYDEYSMTGEYTKDLCIGWTIKPCSEIMAIYNQSLPAWSYTSALDIWGIPITGQYNTYGGGGYIANFDVSKSVSITYLDELFHQRWLDRQSRAVFLEFTLYNAATELFLYCEFMVELPETGAAIPSYKLYPVQPYHSSGPTGNFVIFLEVLFLLHIMAQMVKLSIRVYQNSWRVFLKQFWISYDLAMCVLSIVAVVMFFVRFFSANETMETFRTNKQKYVNFAHIVLWDSLFFTFSATLVFMATLRILEIFASSKKVNAVVKILTRCRSDLWQYSMFFAYILIGFSFLGTVLFGHNLTEYRNVYRSLTTLFLSILGKNRFTEMEEGYPVFAKFFFIMYTVCIIFFILTLFLSTLGESVDTVVHDMRHDTSEDILDHLGKQIKLALFGPEQRHTPTTHQPIFTGDRLQTAFSRWPDKGRTNLK